MANENCPEPGEWTRLLHAALTPERQLLLEQHLDGCPECRQRLEELAGLPPLPPGCPPAGGLDPALVGTGSLLESLVRKVVAEGTQGAAGGEKPLDPAAFLHPGLLEPSTRAGSLGRIGQFDVLSIVGRGGLGVVLRAFDQRLNRVVAIKIPAPELVANPMVRRRFQREAQSAAAVSHENVVRIYAVDEARDIPFLVMEYIDGGSLQQELDRRGALDVTQVVRIGMQLSQGLAAAHKQGLVHRDIKPANILLDGGLERVKLTDFGLARAVDDATLTHSGVIAGTPQYMSPEQARGETVDSRSDLFSLGSVLYTLCAGRPAFRAESPLAVLRRICDDEPRSLQSLNPEVPDWLAEIIETLLRKHADERYQTAEEVALALESWLAHLQQPRGASAPAFARAGRVESPATRRRPERSAVSWFLLMLMLIVPMMLGAGLLFTALAVPVYFRTSQTRAAMVSEHGWPPPPMPQPRVALTIADARRQIAAGRRWINIVPRGTERGQVTTLELEDSGSRGPLIVSNTVVSRTWLREHLTIEFTVTPGDFVVELVNQQQEVFASTTMSPVAGQYVALLLSETTPPQTTKQGLPAPREQTLPAAAMSVVFTPLGDAVLVAVESSGVYRLPVLDRKTQRPWLAEERDSGVYSRKGANHDATTGLPMRLSDGGTHPPRPPLPIRNPITPGDTGVELGVPQLLFSAPGRFSRLALLNETDLVFSGAADSFDLRSLTDPNRFQRFSGFTGVVWRFAKAHQSPRFASAGEGERVVVWEPGRGVAASLQTGEKVVFGLGLSPDGRSLVTSGDVRHLVLWDLETQQESLVKDNHDSHVATAIEILREGRLMLTAGNDFRAIAWSFPDLERLRVFHGHTGVVTTLAVDEDRRLVATGSNDLTVRLWNLDTAAPLADFHGHTQNITQVAFSPDGRLIVSASHDKTVRLWEVPAAAIAAPEPTTNGR